MGRNNVSKPIDKLDTDDKVIATYRNTTEAAKSIDEYAMAFNIRRVAKGKAKTAYRFKWRYHNAEDRPA